MNLETGSIVGDYQIVGTLGAGGMGKVFKVRNTISDRIEAMKVLLPDLAGEPDLADRFLREIKVLASLEHPNIAGLRTAVRFENQLLMIMEFVEGQSLDERMHQGRLPVADAVAYIIQGLAALSYAHGRGVIHRDIKPANMMLTPDGTVKLMDFGIAKSATDRKLTMTGTTMGSLYYMSPEQINGAQTLDARSDLYSVGVSLYELVTGKHPFDGDSQFAIMSAHLQGTPVPPMSLDPAVQPALNELILLSVNRDPNGRFQSADAFRNALTNVLGTFAPYAAPPSQAAGATVAAPPPAKSHRALWATVGALCCVGIIVAAIELGPWKKTAASGPVSPPQTATQPSQPAVVTQPQQPPADPQPSATAASQPAVTAQPPTQPPVQAPAVQTPVVDTTPKRQPLQPAKSAAANVIPQQPVQQQPRVQQPVTNPVQAPAQSPVQPPAQPPAATVRQPAQPDLSAQRAELQKVREAVVTLSARATSIHSTLQNLQRSQAASGLGLRGDWLTSANLMDSFLRGANDALGAGDAASAKDLMEKAERQVDKLEKALNK